MIWVHVNESGSGSMGADQDKESLGWAYNLGSQGLFWCWMGQELDFIGTGLEPRSMGWICPGPALGAKGHGKWPVILGLKGQLRIKCMGFSLLLM